MPGQQMSRAEGEAILQAPKPGRWKRPALVVAVMLLAAVAWVSFYRVATYSVNPHSHIKRGLRGLELPRSLEFVAERRAGVSGCLGGDCPRVTRYYVSDQTVEELCPQIELAMRAWGVPELRKFGDPCNLQGIKEPWVVRADVVRDLTIDLETKFPPHRSVTVIELIAD